MARITVQEARITTVQIEIQALKIGPKQMTMSIFRQLPLAPLMEPETGALRGIPWGWVNYWWEGCGVNWTYAQIHEPQYLHVVWQDQQTLLRGICHHNPPAPSHLPQLQEGLDIVTRWLVFKWIESAEVVRIGAQGKPYETYFVGEQRKRYTVQLNASVLEGVVLSDEEHTLLRQYIQYPQTKSMQDAYQRLLKKEQLVTDDLTELHELYGHEVWNMGEAKAAYQRLADDWSVQWYALKTLPQLFIAV